MRKPHPLVHKDYRGLTSLVSPRLFEDCITHAAQNLRDQLGFGLVLSPVHITRCLKEFQAMIEEAKDDDLYPEPRDLVDLYADLCRMLSKHELVAETDDAGSSVIAISKGIMKQNISNILAVTITLSLFQDEFIVNYSECHIPRALVFTLARRIKDTPELNMFSIHELKTCRYLDQHTY